MLLDSPSARMRERKKERKKGTFARWKLLPSCNKCKFELPPADSMRHLTAMVVDVRNLSHLQLRAFSVQMDSCTAILAASDYYAFMRDNDVACHVLF